MKSIIFDLDMTLVDSSIAEEARKCRQWGVVYSLIPQFRLYQGLNEFFDFIRKENIKVAIVSTAPKEYVRRVCDHFNIPYNILLGYHDCKPIKPHPASILKAIELLGERAENVIGFGDRAIDMQAYNAAGIASVACLWGTKERNALIEARGRYAIERPEEGKEMVKG